MYNRILHLQTQLTELQKKVFYLEKQSNDDLARQKTTTLAGEKTEIPLQVMPSKKKTETVNAELTPPEVNNSAPKVEIITEPQLTKPSTAEPIGSTRVASSPFEKSKLDNSDESGSEGRFLAWLIKGNPVAKVAIIILFFGLSYLFKYIIEHGLLSPEIRVLGALALGITLLTIGWRLRHKKELYALILQGVRETVSNFV